MGKTTEYNLEYVQKFYLEQFLKGNFKSVEFNSKSTQPKSPFEKLFQYDREIDYIEEVDKTIVCQWLSEQNDYRYKNYIDVHYEPEILLSLKQFKFNEIFSLLSPHNVENTTRLIN